MDKINWWIKTNDKEDYKKVLSLAKSCGYMTHEYEEDGDDFSDFIGIGLFVRMPDMVTDTKMIYLTPEACFIEEEDNYGKLVSKSGIEDRVKNFKSVVDEYVSKILNDLNKMINKYPELTIGKEIMTDIDYEYKFYKMDHFTYHKIIGYSWISSWHLRSDKGYPDFERAILKGE